jgi:hypothetical protein
LVGEPCEEWAKVRDALAVPQPREGCYPAHEDCPETFTRFNRDHPSMLFACGFIPPEGIEKEAMLKTADRVLAEWDLPSLWGWDFALLAMTYAALGEPEKALDVLLMETEKNTYVASGNNFQKGREDLPLYLPGNGALLFALPFLLECGFPANGKWQVKSADIFSSAKLLEIFE